MLRILALAMPAPSSLSMASSEEKPKKTLSISACVRAVADILLSRLPENPRILDVGGGPGTYPEACV